VQEKKQAAFSPVAIARAVSASNRSAVKIFAHITFWVVL
jgi:hypothetical protein